MGSVILGILGFAVVYGLLVWALYFARKSSKRRPQKSIAMNFDSGACDWSPVYGSCACGGRAFYLHRAESTGKKLRVKGA